MQLSIITINYNNKGGLKKTINSVVNQTFNDLEYIIIDGGSSDGSVDIIKEYQNQVDYWVSEKDRGIYNAMNKGINIAKGEYLLFLNSGDYFCNQSVLHNFLKETNDIDIIYGKQYYEYPNGELRPIQNPPILTLNLFFSGYSLPHQATLIKRQLFSKYGLYDESLTMVADWKFFLLAIFKWNCTIISKDFFIVNFNLDGISQNKNKEYINRWKIENESVLLSEFPNFKYIKSQNENALRIIGFYLYLKSFKILKKMGLFKLFSLYVTEFASYFNKSTFPDDLL